MSTSNHEAHFLAKLQAVDVSPALQELLELLAKVKQVLPQEQCERLQQPPEGAPDYMKPRVVDTTHELLLKLAAVSLVKGRGWSEDAEFVELIDIVLRRYLMADDFADTLLWASAVEQANSY